MYQTGKLLYTSCFTNLTPQHVEKAFPDIYSSPMLPHIFSKQNKS